MSRVQINYASGGTYRGEMKHGRITGKGEFVSCLGERCATSLEGGKGGRQFVRSLPQWVEQRLKRFFFGMHDRPVGPPLANVWSIY